MTLSVLLLLMSCNANQDKVTAPSVLLPENVMVDVMTDVYIIENAINHRRGKNIKNINLKTRGFDAVFSHYGITDSVFIINLDYYNDNPEKMKKIMDSVNMNFQRMQKQLKESNK